METGGAIAANASMLEGTPETALTICDTYYTFSDIKNHADADAEFARHSADQIGCFPANSGICTDVVRLGSRAAARCKPDRGPIALPLVAFVARRRPRSRLKWCRGPARPDLRIRRYGLRPRAGMRRRQSCHVQRSIYVCLAAQACEARCGSWRPVRRTVCP